MTVHDTWEQIHSSRAWGVYPSEYVIRFIARNYYQTRREDVRVLDFGCGQGAHTWYLAREGFDTYAFDISESAIEKMKVRLEKENLFAHMRVMDGMKLDYPENFFDAAVDSACIAMNKAVDARKMYQNIFKVLKPGGKLLTHVFGKGTTGYGTGTLIEPNTYENMPAGNLQHTGRVHFYEREELLQILTDIGFHTISIDPMRYTDDGNDFETYTAIGTK